MPGGLSLPPTKLLLEWFQETLTVPRDFNGLSSSQDLQQNNMPGEGGCLARGTPPAAALNPAGEDGLVVQWWRGCPLPRRALKKKQDLHMGD